ncbi:MAG TPA: magnesium transporter CorA family protein [Nitrososphaeraceae archaeon]|nr:magnesium transporter CorA family protein [Nitrososphaeraceae archaeon]
MHKIFSYNKHNLQVIDQFSLDDLQNENKVWIDIENPTSKEISWIEDTFNIDNKIVKQYLAGSKKSQIRILEEYTFTSIVNVKFKNLQTLTTQPIYIFLGKNWLITVHSSEINLNEKVHQMFDNDKTIAESSIKILYYNILTKIIENYEHLLTAIEIALTDFEEKSLFNYSIEVLRQLKDLSHQLIMLRRYFWKVREIFSFLTYQEQEIEAKQNIKYLKILYNNVDELVHLIESYKDTINSIRELYIANVSLQMNDTVKTLTIFSAILLPLTFITSFYGMNGLDLNNFSSLPFGTILVSITMGIILSILILFFRKKQWILRKREIPADAYKIKVNSKNESRT